MEVLYTILVRVATTINQTDGQNLQTLKAFFREQYRKFQIPPFYKTRLLWYF